MRRCTAPDVLSNLRVPELWSRPTSESKKRDLCNELLAAFEFTPDELEEYSKLPSISCLSKNGIEIEVPAVYIRAKATKSFKKAWLNFAEATHILLITDANNEDELAYPINETVLLSQCGTWQRTLWLAAEQIPNMKPCLKLNVPFIRHIDALLRFMHTHDESQLFTHLEKIWSRGSPAGQQSLRDFASNVRHLGLVNERIRDCAADVMLEETAWL